MPANPRVENRERKSRLPPEIEAKRAEAIAQRLRGVQIIEIADRIGIDRKKIMSWLANHANREGVKWPPYIKSERAKELMIAAHKRAAASRYEKARDHTPGYKAKIVAAARVAGATFRSVAQVNGLHEKTVRRWVMEAGRIERRAKKAGVTVVTRDVAPAGGGGGGLLDRLQKLEAAITKINHFLFGDTE